jgi:DNA-directed RNA polymerase subunit RPC12/RpoP
VGSSIFTLRYLTCDWKRLKAKYFSFVETGYFMERTGIVYECMRCGARVPSEELELRGGETKCIICGYRILKKVKPPVVKRVQAK